MDHTAELEYGQKLQDQLLDGFSGKIEAVAIPAAYKVGLFLVAIFMVLLPLVYIAMIAGVGWFCYWHATENVTLFENRSGKGALTFYAGPLVIGGLLIAFMVKPLFAKSAKTVDENVVSEDDEPILFAFVRHLCDVVGAPMPSLIVLDNEVNASASFRSGLVSMARKDLRLTIGLPLMGGLSLNQFAGVLAHEFGHFAQTTGMGFTYVIRSINAWFARMVYGRDEYDEMLENAKDGTWGTITIVLMLAQFFVWLTRRILWVLMQLGHGVSCFMMRQMEFDADRYEARLVGGEVFESTCRELTGLSLSMHYANNDQQNFYGEGKLCNDMSALTLAHRLDQDKVLKEHIDNHIESSKTSWMDTHPCDSERIKNAYREGMEPRFSLDLPARILFRDFDDASRKVTLNSYEFLEMDQSNFRPLDELKSSQKRSADLMSASNRYFQLVVTPYIWPEFKEYGPRPTSQEEIAAAFTSIRAKILNGLAQQEEIAKATAEAFDAYTDTCAFRMLSVSGAKPTTYKDSKATSELEDEQEEAFKQARAKMQPYEAAVSARLGLAMSLLDEPEIQKKVPGYEAFTASRDSMQKALDVIMRHQQTIEAWRKEVVVSVKLLNALGDDNENEKLSNTFFVVVGELMALLNKFRDDLKPLSYPFDHADEHINLKDFLMPGILSLEDPVEVIRCGSETLNGVIHLMNRIHSEFAGVAEQVELAFDLEPMPEPNENLIEAIWSYKC